MLDNRIYEETLPNIQSKSPRHKVRPFPWVQSLVTWEKRLTPSFFQPQVAVQRDEVSPHLHFFQTKQHQFPQSLLWSCCFLFPSPVHSVPFTSTWVCASIMNAWLWQSCLAVPLIKIILLLSKANTAFLLLLRTSYFAPVVPMSLSGTLSKAHREPLNPQWDSSAIICWKLLNSCY